MHSNQQPNYKAMNGRQVSQNCDMILEDLPFLDSSARHEVQGHWRIADPKAHKKWCIGIAVGLHPGNCYEVNTALFRKMKPDYPGLRLVSVRMVRMNIDHCFVLDGDIFYDHSQHQQRKLCAREYSEQNVAKMYSSWKDPPPAPWNPRAEATENIYHRKGPLTFTDSTWSQAMKKIINL
jgi:hypothetical protein